MNQAPDDFRSISEQTHTGHVVLGPVVVPYGRNGNTGQKGWFLPWGRFTTSRKEAEECASQMLKVMGLHR